VHYILIVSLQRQNASIRLNQDYGEWIGLPGEPDHLCLIRDQKIALVSRDCLVPSELSHKSQR